MIHFERLPSPFLALVTFLTVVSVGLGCWVGGEFVDPAEFIPACGPENVGHTYTIELESESFVVVCDSGWKPKEPLPSWLTNSNVYCPGSGRILCLAGEYEMTCRCADGDLIRGTSL